MVAGEKIGGSIRALSTSPGGSGSPASVRDCLYSAQAEPVIARHVAAHLPFLATERLLMRGVKAGGDRQRLHEVIRTHSLAVAQAVAEQGAPNDVLERLARDPAFKAMKIAVRPEELEPTAYVGRAPRQVDDFLDHVLPDVLRRIEAVAPAAVAAEVTV